MKYLYMLLLLLVITSLTAGQGSLQGIINDYSSSSPLSSVYVYIPELQRGVISGSDGKYLITDLPLALIHVQFSLLGYKTITETIEITSAGNEMNVTMQQAALEIDEIVVTGSPFETAQKVPYKVESLGSSERRTNGRLTLTGSLADLPGINELSNGTGLSRPVVRGLSGYRVAAVVNGVRFDNQQWQEEHGFGIEDAGTGRIEIIEGPASLFYGAEALGGVINLLPEPNAPVGRITGDYNLKLFTNTLGAYSSAGIKGSTPTISWRINAVGQTHADYLAGNEEKIPNTRFATLNLNAGAGYFYNWGFLNIDYTFAHNVYGVVEEGELTNPKDLQEDHFEREFEGPHHVIGYHIVSLSNMFFAGLSRFKLAAAFQNNHRVEQEGAEEISDGSENGELDLLLNTFTYSFDWIYALSPAVELTAGTQGTIQKNENEGGRILIPDADDKEYAGYIYIRSLFSRFVVQAGIRGDIKSIKTNYMRSTSFTGPMEASDNKYKIINGAAGISYAVTGFLTTKFNFATGYRAPNLAELASNGKHEGTFRYEIGDFNLKSEHNFQYDAGITFQFGNFSAGVSYFYNDVKDFIYLQPQDEFVGPNRIYRFLQQDASLTGGEVTLDFKPVSLLDVNASWSSVTGKKKDGTFLPFMPADKASGTVRYFLPGGTVFHSPSVFIGAAYYFKQTKTAPAESPSPGYTLVDAGAEASVLFFGKEINSSVTVTNLLDEYYISHLSLLKPLGVHGIGRNITLALNVPFSIK